jgi:chromosome segregation ATPase
LPQDQAKQPSAIYSSHASAPEMIVAFETDSGQRFARKYRVSEDGSVSQSVNLNGKSLNQKQVDRALMDLGNPRIFDLRAFNELSEQKKIEFLLALSPPSADLRKMESEMTETDEQINRLRADIRAKKMVIEQLAEERAGLKLPAGTLAEIQAEIEAKSADHEKAQDELKKAELEEQKRKDEEAAKERERIAREKAEAKARREKEEAEARERQAKKNEADALKRVEEAQKELGTLREEKGRNEAHFDELMRQAAEQLPVNWRSMCLNSLEKVRETLTEAGCEVCAGLIILNLEIQKFQEEGEVL